MNAQKAIFAIQAYEFSTELNGKLVAEFSHVSYSFVATTIIPMALYLKSSESSCSSQEVIDEALQVLDSLKSNELLPFILPCFAEPHVFGVDGHCTPELMNAISDSIVHLSKSPKLQFSSRLEIAAVWLITAAALYVTDNNGAIESSMDLLKAYVGTVAFDELLPFPIDALD